VVEVVLLIHNLLDLLVVLEVVVGHFPLLDNLEEMELEIPSQEILTTQHQQMVGVMMEVPALILLVELDMVVVEEVLLQ